MLQKSPEVTGRNLALEAVRVTELAALAAARLMGCGDDEAVDKAAVDAMHGALHDMAMKGVVRIGEGAEGEVDRLYLGERVGTGEGPAVDVATMPLEGPTIIARGDPNGLSIVAMTEGGSFLQLPGLYMEKIAVGVGLPEGIIDLDGTPAENLTRIAAAKGVEISDLVVCILDRPRNGDLIARVRETGSRVMLIGDGDVSGVIATLWPKSGIDVYMGIGGAPQGVIAAAAMSCLGGQMQGRLVVRGGEDRQRIHAAGIQEPDAKLGIADMATGNMTFAATGVTPGHVLAGVRRFRGVPVTHSLVLRSRTATMRFIESYHNFSARMPPDLGLG